MSNWIFGVSIWSFWFRFRIWAIKWWVQIGVQWPWPIHWTKHGNKIYCPLSTMRSQSNTNHKCKSWQRIQIHIWGCIIFPFINLVKNDLCHSFQYIWFCQLKTLVLVYLSAPFTSIRWHATGLMSTMREKEQQQQATAKKQVMMPHDTESLTKTQWDDESKCTHKHSIQPQRIVGCLQQCT